MFAFMVATCCSFQTDKWTEPGNLPESCTLSEIGHYVHIVVAVHVGLRYVDLVVSIEVAVGVCLMS
jgi:hypothetical protein